MYAGGGTSPEKATMDYCFAHGFTAGKNFKYYGGYPIDANWPWLISVGDDVMLSSNVRILAHDASTGKAGAHTKIGIVRIGNNVFIGANSVVLPGVSIGDDVVVGAGTVVSKDIESNSVVAGNPMKVIGKTDEFIRKHANNMRKFPVWNTYWKDKSKEEREDMVSKLESYGYDA